MQPDVGANTYVFKHVEVFSFSIVYFLAMGLNGIWPFAELSNISIVWWSSFNSSVFMCFTDLDPVQRLFLEKIKEYDNTRR